MASWLVFYCVHDGVAGYAPLTLCKRLILMQCKSSYLPALGQFDWEEGFGMPPSSLLPQLQLVLPSLVCS